MSSTVMPARSSGMVCLKNSQKLAGKSPSGWSGAVWTSAAGPRRRLWNHGPSSCTRPRSDAGLLAASAYPSTSSGTPAVCNDEHTLHFAIFGLTISSSWAQGHATPWRGILKGLRRAGHTAIFFERDVPYYREHRDLPAPDFCELVLYDDWEDVLPRARAAVRNADVAMVTSYCPDGLAACRLVLDAPGPLHVFYDLDTPVTLAALDVSGVARPDGARYLMPDLIPAFDLYLSFTGGAVLDDLRDRWGARQVRPLYGCVDPEVHAPIAHPPAELRCALGYLGTYAADRQRPLEQLLLDPARRR